jgi:orotidine-5'-phosphate decarboxylase
MGGKEMMLMAKQVVSKHTKLLAITQLTSTDKQMLKNQLLINQPLKDVVCHYAKLAASVKIDGVVCAVDEVKLIKQVINKKFITICPGIRNDKQHQDQKRVATIAQAKASGTDYVVIGRPITTAKDPLAIYLNFRNQF